MSLRRVCRELVLEVVLRRALAAEEGEREGRLQLVVDEKTLRILNSFLKMGDLHSEGVTSMELIERPREPLPGLDALYLLRPTPANIDYVLADFQSSAEPQHRHAHFAFTQALPHDLMAMLAESKTLAPRVKSFMEAPLTYLHIQDRGFHFDMLDSLPALFPVADPALVQEVAHKLADVCRCLHVTSPCIRHAATLTCKLVAEQVQEELSVSRSGGKGEHIPCQLLVLDRSIDMAATLVHEYTYEAMSFDLLDGGVLDVDRNLVTLPGTPEREVLLSDVDPLWQELKHAHLEDVQRTIDAKVEEVKRQNATPQDSGQISTAELLDMLRRSPEQREVMDRLFLHMTLIEQIFKRLQQECLTSGVGLVEQDIACGVDREGKDVKSTSLQSAISRAFSDMDGGQLSSESKLRLLMLYFTCMANVSEVARQRLIELARLEPEDQDVLMAMLRTKLMEVPESQRHRHGSGAVHRVTKEQAARFKRNARSDGRFELSRFEPRVKEVLEQLAQGRLSSEDFPALEGCDNPTNSLRSAAAAPQPAADDWSFAAVPEGSAPGTRRSDVAESPVRATVSQRIIVFVIGGITHSELRSAAEVLQGLPKSTELLLGGTALLTPRKLMSALRPRRGEGTTGETDPLDLT